LPEGDSQTMGGALGITALLRNSQRSFAHSAPAFSFARRFQSAPYCFGEMHGCDGIIAFPDRRWQF